jgi:hypothetical protein
MEVPPLQADYRYDYLNSISLSRAQSALALKDKVSGAFNLCSVIF